MGRRSITGGVIPANGRRIQFDFTIDGRALSTDVTLGTDRGKSPPRPRAPPPNQGPHCRRNIQFRRGVSRLPRIAQTPAAVARADLLRRVRCLPPA